MKNLEARECQQKNITFIFFWGGHTPILPPNSGSVSVVNPQPVESRVASCWDGVGYIVVRNADGYICLRVCGVRPRAVEQVGGGLDRVCQRRVVIAPVESVIKTATIGDGLIADCASSFAGVRRVAPQCVLPQIVTPSES